jgi:hypothetical protein
VTLIALASVKGSPGVTTAATALAASWPEGRQVLLVEADPFGGDLAPRYAMAPTGGLSSLFAAARRSLQPEDVWDHVDHLPGGLPVLFGLGGMHQAVANEKAWPVVAEVLSTLDADVVIDVGRLLPSLGGGVREVLARADALVVLCPSTLEAIVHLREALPSLIAELRGRSLLVVPTGVPQFSAADIGRTLAIEVLPPMPDDPGAAAALANRRSVKRLERTRMLRWAADTLGPLGIEAVLPVESEVPQEAGEQIETDTTSTTTTEPADMHQPDEPPDGTQPEVQLAATAWSTTREVV